MVFRVLVEQNAISEMKYLRAVDDPAGETRGMVEIDAEIIFHYKDEKDDVVTFNYGKSRRESG